MNMDLCGSDVVPLKGPSFTNLGPTLETRQSVLIRGGVLISGGGVVPIWGPTLETRQSVLIRGGVLISGGGVVQIWGPTLGD